MWGDTHPGPGSSSKMDEQFNAAFLTAELAVKICGLLPPRILATPIFYPLIWITNLTEAV